MSMNRAATAETKPGKHAVVIGLGNIGSPLVEMLARTEMVSRLTLVDRDIYETTNLCAQAIQPGDVGKPKAFVQAERARRIRPDLHVEAIHSAVGDVPPGRLRGDVVLTGLDSKLSRQQVNQIIWRLGVPWVDAGVMADETLARVNAYLPADNQPCSECSWDEKDYQTLEVRRPCQAEDGTVPTHAPAFLGSLAAALQMTELTKILAGDWRSVAVGKQITIAAAAHKLYETTFRRNPRCRFDHVTCRIHPLPCSPEAFSLGELMIGLERESGVAEGTRYYVEGKSFVRRLRCACGEEKPVFCLVGRMAMGDRSCWRCGGIMDAVGFSMFPFLSDEILMREDRNRPLADVGLETGDLIMMKGRGGLKAFELVAA